MSTSDAVHSEAPTVEVGGETATPPRGQAHAERTSTARQGNGHETTHLQHSCRRANTHERTPKALIFGADGPRQEVDIDCGPRYTTRIVLRLSNNLDLDKSEIRLKRKQDSCVDSSNEPQRSKTVGSSSQVNKQTSVPDTSREVTSDSPIPEKIQFLAKKDKDIITVACNGHKSRIRLPCGSTELEQTIKDCAKLEKQTDVEALSDSSEVMLSSAMVTVLGPTWSGRLRRSKRFEATGSLETLANLPGLVNSEASHSQDYSQGSQSDMGRVFNVSQAQSRPPFLSSRQNTTGWSTKSGPQILDYESRSKVAGTVSLDGSAKETEIKKAEASCTWGLYGQKRNPQDGYPVRLSSLSSKPTTSSLLLSLRRINNQNMNSHNPTPSEVKPMSLKSDQDAKLISRHPSQPFHKRLEREKLKPLPSSLSISPREPETQPISSTPLTNRNKISASKTSLFSSSTMNKVTIDTPKQPQRVNKRQPSLPCSREAFPSQRPSEKKQNWSGSGSGLNLFSDSVVSSHNHLQYDSGLLSESGTPPRKTSGISSSRWQQNSHKISATAVHTDTPNIINKPNTPIIPLRNNNCDAPALSPTNNRSLNCQISNSTNCATTEPVCNGSVNPVIKPQKAGTGSVKEKHSNYSLDKLRLSKQLYESSLRKLQPQKSQSLPDGQSTLDHPRDSIKHDVSNGSFKAHVSELAPTLLNPNSTAPPESKYRNDHCSLITNNTHQSKTINPFSSYDSTITLKSQVVASKNVAGFSQNPIARPSFQSKPDFSQTNINISSLIGSTSQTPKVANRATTNSTPFGFRRSYAATPKPFQPKTECRHVPMANNTSNENCSPGSMTASLATPTTPTQISSTSTPAMTSHLQTPSTSPISPNRKVGGILTNQSGKDNKKLGLGHRKKVKHVMWEDAENSEPAKSPDPSVLTSPLSRSRSQQDIRAPSIFSFLRSSSQNTKNTSLCTTSPKTSNLQGGKGEKYQSLSSDSADRTLREGGESKENPSEAMSFDQESREATPCRLRRSLSLQADEFLYHSTALTPPPDFSNGYKIRYSPPPYSTLISSRSETKKATPRTSLFPNLNTNSNYTSNHPAHSHLVADATSPNTKPSPTNSPKPLSSPLQNRMLSLDNSLYSVSQTDEIDDNRYESICRNQQNGRLLLVESSVDVSPQSLQSSKMDRNASAPKNTTPESLQPFTKTLPPVKAKPSDSNQSSSGSSSADSQSVGDDIGNKKMESVMGKFRLFSAESNNEQGPKRRRRFGMKKSVSTPNSETEKSHKSSNKMDQVINKLRQTFSPKRPDDDLLPWKWRRASDTPSVSGQSGTSNTSDTTIESNRTAKCEEQEVGLKDKERTKQGEEWTESSYSIIPTLSVQTSMTENELFIWPDQSNAKDQDKLRFGAKKVSDQIDVKNRATNQFLLCIDHSPKRSPKLTDSHCTKFRNSTSSSKSPFSPFSSLSTHSPFSSPDVADDSVFYSPKMQRRRETSSPCEPGEGISLVSSRRSRASTGPPNTGPAQDEASCYADLKYGIEPGRSVSVSSVLSSRPSGPGRISTGPRFTSVGDLSESVPTYGRADEDFHQWLERNFNHRPISQMQSYFPSDAGKLRSRSLPRSLTRRLAQWSSGVSNCSPADTTSSLSPHRWSPNMNTCHFEWDAVSPPTPPPTPPLSPQPRRMSKPPSLSSPNFPSPTGESLDRQSPKGHLPSRNYVSSLSTFEESSDSSSDTTTDDEYYFEKSDEEEKETEL
ncbi:mucin-2 [Phycodurus eques]|uniref:mucin-2 n=1 Tax=Phycodurus eques TaxID=693459 RepID=UPI002ACE5CA4|nr:mucin-2 [Phycodurus eques]